ncbi:MAG: hypothetical protein JW725_00330 [Candidatus Babeliaceae bacterium]|nr:hypothetical protein [Candidatus Babeliaceae bacterium]
MFGRRNKEEKDISIMLLGPAASGKTSFARALSRIHRLSDGKFLINFSEPVDPQANLDNLPPPTQIVGKGILNVRFVERNRGEGYVIDIPLFDTPGGLVNEFLGRPERLKDQEDQSKEIKRVISELKKTDILIVMLDIAQILMSGTEGILANTIKLREYSKLLDSIINILPRQDSGKIETPTLFCITKIDGQPETLLSGIDDLMKIGHKSYEQLSENERKDIAIKDIPDNIISENDRITLITTMQSIYRNHHSMFIDINWPNTDFDKLNFHEFYKIIEQLFNSRYNFFDSEMREELGGKDSGAITEKIKARAFNIFSAITENYHPNSYQFLGISVIGKRDIRIGEDMVNMHEVANWLANEIKRIKSKK